MARKKPRRKGRTSQQNIDSGGCQIYEKGDQITILTDKQYDVKSQNREGVTYRVSYGLEKFTCECPYHVHGNGCRCKHMAAAEYMLLQNAESSAMKETIIDEMKLKCTGCGSQEYVKNGHDTKCKSSKKRNCFAF